MNVFIRGIGSYFPAKVRANHEWPTDFGQRQAMKGDRLFNDIPQATNEAARITDRHLLAEASDPFLGTIERRVADDDLTSTQAELLASKAALADAKLEGADIDLVISYSVVPDRPTPASATRIASELGATRAAAFSMDAACATALVQLQTAAALIESGQAKHVLLTQSHLLLRAFPMLHPAAPGLGDGASALVVSGEGKLRLLGTHSVTHGEFHEAVTWVRGDSEADDTGWWKAGADFRVGSRDRGGAKALQRDTVSFAAQTLRELFAKAGADIERLGLFCSVEPRGWVPAATLELLGLAPGLAMSIYQKYGHLGAVGPVANLAAAYGSGRTRGNGLIALYAQGAGFTRAAALLTMDDRT